MRDINELDDLVIEVSRVFSPSVPVDEKDLFAGRSSQVLQIIDAVNQRGQHAVVFGERGVGKTSLANMLNVMLSHSKNESMVIKVNCDSTDDYASIWRKVFNEIPIRTETKSLGFNAQNEINIESAAQYLPTEIKPDNIIRLLKTISQNGSIIIIIDEFDRISTDDISIVFSDTIKTLSDYAVNSTLILVGIADSVDDLITGHESIERALVQISMPRMTKNELDEIINKGLSKLGMTIDNNTLNYISTLSQGFPHYTHLLGLYSARQALNRSSHNISVTDFDGAIETSLTNTRQSTEKTYHVAISSPRKENIYKFVLLACVLTKTDELGYFSAASLRDPLSKIMNKQYNVTDYSRHLHDFCTDKRSNILIKVGTKHNNKFRFKNPLMQPYIVMQGISDGTISKEELSEIKTD